MKAAGICLDSIERLEHHCEKLNKRHDVKRYFKTNQKHSMLICIPEWWNETRIFNSIIIIESYTKFKRFHSYPNKGFYFVNPDAVFIDEFETLNLRSI